MPPLRECQLARTPTVAALLPNRPSALGNAPLLPATDLEVEAEVEVAPSV
jgi:hypothetical protein